MPLSEGQHWYVVQTKPRSESLAAESLRRVGVGVFLPLLDSTLGGRRATTDGSPVEPLFPGYLFARLDLADRFRQATWARGVRSFVSFGDAIPEPLDDRVVEILRERAGGGDVLRPSSRLRPGQTVEVRRGPFAGLLGVVDRPIDGAGRVRILLELLQRRTSVDLQVGALASL